MNHLHISIGDQPGTDLASHVANDRRFLALVEEGKQAVREGRMVDHASVVAALERIVGPNT